jgi:hypothetical protein
LLFFGLAEEGPEEESEKLVRQLLVSKMEIDLKEKDIEYCEVKTVCYSKINKLEAT